MSRLTKTMGAVRMVCFRRACKCYIILILLGVSSSFRTDADISGNLSLRERNLQRWEPSADSALDLSLDSGGQDWDQFETNKRLYGVQSSYNEDFYTTKIDKSHPEYAQRAAHAERIAREIEGGAAATGHVAEERGLKTVDDSGLDEEDKLVAFTCHDIKITNGCG
jgi:PAB1-binding protein PBP1